MWYPKIILRQHTRQGDCEEYVHLLVITDQTMVWVWDMPHRNVSGVVMWIECTATCLESRWIRLLEMSHALGRVNLSSFVGLELLGAVIAHQWCQEKRRLDYDSKSSNEIQTSQDQRDHVPRMFVCGIGIDDALVCISFLPLVLEQT